MSGTEGKEVCPT
ncbi:hypothetical protein A2U01_0074495, partial [Trifolium medium]|nr:hypothetical protein [Trifolium medium]